MKRLPILNSGWTSFFIWTWSLPVQGHGVQMSAVEGFFCQYLDQDESQQSELKHTLDIVLDAMKGGVFLKIHVTKKGTALKHCSFQAR